MNVKYNLQHNGKGKYHLIPIEGEGYELCGSFGSFLFSHVSEFETEGEKLYEFDPYSSGKREVDELQIREEFCKKCIKKAMKKSGSQVSNL